MSTKSSQSSCGKQILRRLNIKDKTIKPVFQHYSVLGNIVKDGNYNQRTTINGYEKHAELFFELLNFVINNLDNPKIISDKCEEIGRAHRRIKIFGMKIDHLDLVGESIIETVREYQGWRRHRQAVGATNIIISFVIDRIRTGFIQRIEIPLSVKTPQPSIDYDNESFTSSIRRTYSNRNNNHYDNNNYQEKWKKITNNIINNNNSIKRRRLLPLPPVNDI